MSTGTVQAPPVPVRRRPNGARPGSGNRRAALRTGLVVLAVLVLWEVVGRLRLVAGGALPAPTAIAGAWWEHRADYPRHIWATTRAAVIGFVLGNLVAVALAVTTQLVPVVERLIRPLTVVLFCLPVVVAAPILGLAFPGDWPQILLAVLLVFFPTMISTRLGLERVPGEAITVIRSAGGGSLRALRLVRLRAAVPDLMSGLQIAAPAAFLGAILGEFLGGRYGLGVYLIGSMGRGRPDVIWAIGLTATVLSAAVYGLVGLARRLSGTPLAHPTVDPAGAATRARRSWPATVGWTGGGIAVIIVAWYAFLAVTGLPRTLMNSPVDVWRALVTAPGAGTTRDRVGAALAESLPPAVIGTVAGVAVAFVLAVVLGSMPSVAQALLPFAFVSQTIPLVALAPLIALSLGRGTATTIAVTVSVTFFPSLLTMLSGIAQAPDGPLQVLRSVDAGRVPVMRLVVLPSAVPHLLASVRLAVPRALTGVLIAEQFITGQGLGGLLSQARGYLDYRMMWVVTTVVALLSLLAYAAAQLLEERVLTARS